MSRHVVVLCSAVFASVIAGCQVRPPPTRGGCTQDSDCGAGKHCEASGCVDDLENGAACDESSDCRSAHCEGGFCCSSGTCCSVAADCPASFSSAPSCTDPATCQGTRSDALCVSAECASSSVTDDSGCSSDTLASDCGPYPAVYCSGDADQTAPVCASGCADDTQCAAGAHCSAGTCVPDGANGWPCQADADCASGNCAAGYCCTPGSCCAPGARPAVAAVAPAIVSTAAPSARARVRIRGTGLVSAPTVTWVRQDGSAAYEARYVGFVSATEIVTDVPPEMLQAPPGGYHVFVANPGSCGAAWMADGTSRGVFTVTAAPPPKITSVDPRIVDLGTCTSNVLAVAATGLDAGARAFYVARPGDVCPATTIQDADGNDLCEMPGALSSDGQSLLVGFDACPATGAYRVAVVNTDGQLDTHDAVEITASADGSLNQGAFAPVASSLVVARLKHGAATAFAPSGDEMLYVAGGESAAPAVVGSVEASRLDLYGGPGPFTELLQASADGTRIPNTLRQAREALALASAGRTLLAIGGATQPTSVPATVVATKTVERARVLGDEEVPALQIPSASGSGLPVGAWYYQVAALGPWGEGLPSDEVVALERGGTLHVCWTAPAASGVAGYNVYRSLAADGRMGTTTLLAANVTSTCFDDTGSAALAPAPGRLVTTVTTGGALAAGTYTYRVSAIVPDGGASLETQASYEASAIVDVLGSTAAVTLTWDPVPSATSYVVYRLDSLSGGFVAVSGGSVGTPAFTDVGGALVAGTTPLVATPPLPPGSLSRWEVLEAARSLGAAREGPDAVSVMLPPATSGGLLARVFVAGGRPSNADAALTSVESIGVYADGSLEAGWTVESAALVTGRSYLSLVTTQGRFDPGFAPQAASGSDTEYLVAVFGLPGPNDGYLTGLGTFEACALDMAGLGHLACGSTWTVQAPADPHSDFGAGALMDNGYLFPFYGVDVENATTTPASRTLDPAATGRYLLDSWPTGSSILTARQTTSTSFGTLRGYYQMVRAKAVVYVVGGWTSSGATGSLESHSR